MALVVEVTNAKFFKAPLSKVYAALAKNVPIQKCILLEADEDTGLTLTGLDTRTHQLRLRVPDAEVFEAGMALVPGDILNDLVSTFEDVSLSISVDEAESKLVLQVGGRRLKIDLYGEDPDVFKELMVEMPDTVAKLEAEELTETIKQSMRLTPKNSFVTIAGQDTDVFIYTMIRNLVFNKARLENRDVADDWSIGVQMDYLCKIPMFVGEAEIHLNAEDGLFAISCGVEHLLIRQTMADAIVADIDALMAQTADSYFVVKSDSLMADLKAAQAIKDKKGIQLEAKDQVLSATCSAKGRGSIRGTHALVDTNVEAGKAISLNFDPEILQKTFEAIKAVDVLAEIIEITIPGWLPDDPPETFYNLRFMDLDKAESRKVVVTSLGVDDQVTPVETGEVDEAVAA